MSPSSPFTLVECPRDAMQGWKRMIATEDKTRYLQQLLQVGFDTLDFGSFVSPKAIPQMADTAQVLRALKPWTTRTRLLAIVANIRGAEEAVAYEQISYLGFPFSLSPTFQQRNTNSTMDESVRRVDEILSLCANSGKQLVVYLSMGFGNPYGDPYNEDILLHWAGEMVSRGVTVLSLADTVGVATAEQVSAALHTLVPAYPAATIGVHLHSTPANWRQKLEAAVTANCTRFDGALNGIGGCPMAQDELVGNMDTTLMIPVLEATGRLPPLDKAALAESVRIAGEIFV